MKKEETEKSKGLRFKIENQLATIPTFRKILYLAVYIFLMFILSILVWSKYGECKDGYVDRYKKIYTNRVTVKKPVNEVKEKTTEKKEEKTIKNNGDKTIFTTDITNLSVNFYEKMVNVGRSKLFKYSISIDEDAKLYEVANIVKGQAGDINLENCKMYYFGEDDGSHHFRLIYCEDISTVFNLSTLNPDEYRWRMNEAAYFANDIRDNIKYFRVEKINNQEISSFFENKKLKAMAKIEKGRGRRYPDNNVYYVISDKGYRYHVFDILMTGGYDFQYGLLEVDKVGDFDIYRVMDDSGAFVVKNEGFTYQVLQFIPPILSFEEDWEEVPQVLVANINGKKIKGKYSYINFFLSFYEKYTIFFLNENLSQLEKVGTAIDGSPLYIKKDPTQLKEIYTCCIPTNNPQCPCLYKNEYGADLTFEEFRELYPILYWEDPFGRIIEFTLDGFSIGPVGAL